MDWQIPDRSRDKSAAIAYFAIEWSLENKTHFANVSPDVHSFEVMGMLVSVEYVFVLHCILFD